MSAIPADLAERFLPVPMSDLPHDQLIVYRSAARAPDDMEEFWGDTLTTARELSSPPTLTPVSTGLELAETWDVEFTGFGGDVVRGWLHRPMGRAEALPAVVHYQGYGGGRGLAHQVPLWVLAGYACLEVDVRGQGSGYSFGDTPDPVGSGPAHPGFMTRGLLAPEDYYYRRVYTDSVLAVDVMRDLPGVDSTRIAVCGGSQGGGIALAVAGLRNDLAAVVADVPFLSDFRRGAELAVKAPYTEIAAYLKIHRDHVEQAFRTLAYFDTCTLGQRATAPAMFSVGLMDETCPPSTVYAAYNAYAGPKRMVEYAFNDHEGGGPFHELEVLSFLAERFVAAAT
jgi:cephalosporin-C deacetylase